MNEANINKPSGIPSLSVYRISDRQSVYIYSGPDTPPLPPAPPTPQLLLVRFLVGSAQVSSCTGTI